MEDIEAELESKTIERVEVEEVVEEAEASPQAEESLVEDTPPHTVSVTPKKVKKPRSEKQILAFEKARLKRAEGIAARKAKKEEDKIKKKEEKKEAKLQDVPVVESQVSVPKPVVNTPTPSHNPREQVIQNHYYYYGVPPPRAAEHDYNEPNKKNRKSSRKRPPTPSSSESESEEEQPQEQQYYEQPKPSYKFGFA